MPNSNRFVNQHRYFARRIDDCLETVGLRLVTLEGQTYDTGTAATALNIADFGSDDMLVIDQMIEPIVMNDTGLLRTGKVMLRKASQ